MTSSFRLPSRRTVLSLLAAAALAGTASAPWAQEAWKPTKPIRLVVPFPPGGGADVAARMVAEGMATRLGQSVVVENKTGAGGSIGSEYAYTAPADGTVVLVAVADALVMYPHLNKVKFETPKFVPIGGIFRMPYVLMGRADLPAANVNELAALMRTKSLSIGNAGAGSSLHILAGMFTQAAKAPDSLHVPFQGAAPGLQALLGGQIDLMMVPLVSAPQYRSKLRTYGIASTHRADSMKDVPTLIEQGYAVSGDSWAGLVAPPGTPEAIAATIGKALRESVATPEMTKRITDMSVLPITSSPAEFAKFYRDEYSKWGEVIKTTGIKVE